MFDFDFLNRIHSGLFAYLQKLILSHRCVCLILNHKLAYVWKDWYNGERYRVSLKDTIAHKEKYEINQICGQNYHVRLFYYLTGYISYWINLVSLQFLLFFLARFSMGCLLSCCFARKKPKIMVEYCIPSNTSFWYLMEKLSLV